MGVHRVPGNLQEIWGSRVGSWDSRSVRSWESGGVSSNSSRGSHIRGGNVGGVGNWGSDGVVHNVSIVGGGIRSNVSQGKDSSAGDSEESEDGGKLRKRMNKRVRV